MEQNEPLITFEEQFKIMADMAPVMIWIADTNKLCCFFNVAWLSFRGRTMEEEYDRGWTAGVHPDDLQHCLDSYSTSFDARTAFKRKYRLRRHDGRYRWVLDHAVPHYTADGTFTGYIGTCMDIDELLESERIRKEFISAGGMAREQLLNEEMAATNEELTASNEELAATNRELIKSREEFVALNALLEERVNTRTAELNKERLEVQRQRDRLNRFFMQAPAGICILDGKDLVFEMANPLYQQLFPGRNLLNKPVLEAIPEIKGQPIYEILQHVYSSGEAFAGDELLVPLARTIGGPVEDRYFNFIYQPRLDENGRVDGILAFAIEVTEMVLAKRKIESNEASLRGLVMSAHYSLMILRGKNFIIEIANQQLANLWNKSLDEITGQRLMDVLPELEGQPFPALLQQVLETGAAYGQEEEKFLLETAEGTIEKYVSFYYDPITEPDGTVSGIIVAAEDITARVKSRLLLQKSHKDQQAINEELAATNEEFAATNEELAATNEELIATNEELLRTQNELLRSEKLFRSIAVNIPNSLVIVIDKDQRFVAVEGNLMKQMGYDAREYEGRHPAEVNPERYEAAKHIYERVLAGEQFSEERKSPAGQDFMVHCIPLKDENGEVYSGLIIALDITELKLAEEKSAKLAAIIRTSDDAIVSKTLEGVITSWNQAAEKIFGYPEEEMVGESILKIIPEDRKEEEPRILAKLRKGERVDHFETRRRTKDGRLIDVSVTISPVMDSQGKIIGVSKIARDISERKQEEARKNDFIGMVSHELKTPLTSLSALIQVANAKLKQSNDAFLSGSLEKAGIQVKKMASMINGFLNVSRLESSKMIMDKRDFIMPELIREAIAEAQLMVSAHHIDFAPCDLVLVHADRDKIGSVVSNLLSNAIKYSPKGGHIEVLCETLGNEVIVSVKDEGIGIKPADQERLFERYFRVQTSHTKHISGFGIGLYLSAEIIKGHEGKIWVESNSGAGSTFRFSLPLKDA